LHTTNPRVFNDEVSALKKLKSHDNLVPLLTCFDYRDRYYLLFPWASGGNLQSFWGKTRSNDFQDLVLWVAQQCHGLANGLERIHDIRLFSGEPADYYEREGQSWYAENEDANFGIHGDIKPQNILRFTKSHSELGVLRISDFGLTKFHTFRSRSNNVPEKMARPLTYNAPEADNSRNISRRYDIWCLGCLYLEFLTWLLLGSEGVKEFTRRRKAERGYRKKMITDQFYKLEGAIASRGTRGVVKSSVEKVSQSVCLPP
jgi:serine/threonine protein kinase